MQLTNVLSAKNESSGDLQVFFLAPLLGAEERRCRCSREVLARVEVPCKGSQALYTCRHQTCVEEGRPQVAKLKSIRAATAGAWNAVLVAMRMAYVFL